MGISAFPGDGSRPLRMVVEKNNLWGVGQVLRVRFLGGNQHVHEEVKKCAKEWEKNANIAFKFVSDEPSDIRISFSQSDGWHSVVGKTALEVPANKPTMNLAFKSEDNLTLQMPSVLHEFGHALGCIHEHCSPAAPISWNEEEVYSYYKNTDGWEKQTVDENVLQRSNCESIEFSEWDPKSIMMYPIPESLTKDGFSAPKNWELSQTDKKFIANAYPKSTEGANRPYKTTLSKILSRLKLF